MLRSQDLILGHLRVDLSSASFLKRAPSSPVSSCHFLHVLLRRFLDTENRSSEFPLKGTSPSSWLSSTSKWSPPQWTRHPRVGPVEPSWTMKLPCTSRVRGQPAVCGDLRRGIWGFPSPLYLFWFAPSFATCCGVLNSALWFLKSLRLGVLSLVLASRMALIVPRLKSVTIGNLPAVLLPLVLTTPQHLPALGHPGTAQSETNSGARCDPRWGQIVPGGKSLPTSSIIYK